ncbi:hypothetical protein F2Q70_00020288 [Brassica cretica]|uniref:DSP-PTPase phosphatase fused to NAD+ Kinase domain-containing protein n=1 Tax=Brassica cretica TaxID=69181 RepID=A0A8S9GMZ4_BRACR|nr:hypothetical protein F2Q70_00020288 [Brassica cretica]
MLLCFCPCHTPHFLMSRLSPATGISPRLHCSVDRGVSTDGRFRFGFRRIEVPFKRRLRFVIKAELSEAFSPDLGLDSQVISLLSDFPSSFSINLKNRIPSMLSLCLLAVKSRDTSNLPWIGPVPGDIAEVEAYCRIFRSAERLHGALMETLCNPVTGECRVPYDFSPEEKPLLEDKIVSVLGCILSLLNKGRKEILSGRSSSMNSFSLDDVGVAEDTLPPLAVFRGEMKRCCESLHIALENYLTPDDERSGIVWRKLQKLKNVCYDAGFPRSDSYPCQTLFANWDPIYSSNMKEDTDSYESEIAFWRGGQVTQEGLKWLLEKGFKTIVDLRAENVKDTFYQAALDDAISTGKITLVKIPIEVRMAPLAQQVELFASVVSDSSKRPIYVHSKEGVWRTSAMVQGDGVIVATPTGSTAYSTAAGGSMVHPNVPCMLFTPICPHSLSFRPVILPDSAKLELKIPDDARSNAWVSFDGKRRQQLSRGDSVRIYMSQHPLPTVNKSDQTGDWFRSLIRCLNWNERLDQKAL